MSEKEIKAYYESSNWEPLDSFMITTRRKFSEEDGKSSPEEDFANNVEHYFINQINFKKEFPQIYKWIDQFIKEEK